MGAQTKVGMLVAGALVLFGVTVFVLGQQEHLWRRKVGYLLQFARTNGLQAGAPVSLSGVPIGTVEAIQFAGDPARNVIDVTVSVDARDAARIRTDTVATIRTLGLLGDKYIELVPGNTPEAKPLPPGEQIASTDPTDYESILGQSGDIVTNVVEVTAALKDVLQPIQRGEGLLGAMLQNREFGETTLQALEGTLVNVRGTSQKLDHILERVDRGEGVIGRLMRDSKESKQIMQSLDRSVRSLERLTRRLEDGRGAAVRLMEDQAYGDRLLERLDRAVEGLDAVLTKMNQGEGTLGKLVNDPTLYDESSQLVSELRSSWLVRFYELLRGLWPVSGSRPAPEPEPEAEATP